MARTVLIVSRVFGVYQWKHRIEDAEAWFDERIELLRRIALPALAQVKTPLVWIWQAHRSKMDLVEDRLQHLDTGSLDVRIVDQDTISLGDVRADTDKFLTFRLDTDDAFLPEAIDGVAEKDWADRSLIDFRRGVTLDWATGAVKHRSFTRFQGPFLAVTQDRDRMLDVGGNHRLEARDGRSVEEIDDISWVQVVHGGNAANTIPAEPGRDAYAREGAMPNGAPVTPELREWILRSARIELP